MNDQRKILLKKSPKEWNSYINQELTQYLKKHYVQQSDVDNWISDKEKLLRELWQNEKNKEEERKRKEEMEKIEKMKKMEQMNLEREIEMMKKDPMNFPCVNFL